MVKSFLLSSFFITTLFAQSDAALFTGIARDNIVEHLTQNRYINRTDLLKKHPFLQEKGAVFVTLNKRDNLRGCIGSLQAHRSLLDDLLSNSYAAAFRDLRFTPLSKDELSELEVEVSILTEPKKVFYDDITSLKAQIVPEEDGIELVYGRHRSTYLPQVWEQLPDFDTFFSYLCEKAELPKECLNLKPNIYRYHVKKFSEKSLSKRPTPNVGLFYPQSCQETKQWFQKFDQKMKAAHLKLPAVEPKALIVPHAGYRYSGYTANLAYRVAQQSHAKRVVVVGPSHRVSYEGISVANYEAFQTPCGILRNDEVFAERLRSQKGYGFVKGVHEKEHSTEVQLPFINHYMPQMKVVELIYGHDAERDLVTLMMQLLQDPETLLIVSSDLSHFYTQKDAQKHDFICLEAVEKRDVVLLNSGCEACGFTGIEALLQAVRRLGLKSKILDYRSSAAATGDTRRVVGYMSALFY